MHVTLFVGSQSINILLLMTSHGSWFAEELKVLKRKNPELFPFFPATILTLKNHIHAPIHPPILHVQPERSIADYVNLLKLQKKEGKNGNYQTSLNVLNILRSAPGGRIIDNIEFRPGCMGVSFRWIGFGIFEASSFPRTCLGIHINVYPVSNINVGIIFLSGIRKKIRAEKSQTFFLLNLFPPSFSWFIQNKRCHRNGRPLILKLIPNHEEWKNEIE